jgi:hypothetical protein
MSSQYFPTFSVILLVLGHLECSSSADACPALKCECHSKTVIWLQQCSVKASQSISRVSVANLPTFTQGLMQIHCSILPSIADLTKHEVRKALV